MRIVCARIACLFWTVLRAFGADPRFRRSEQSTIGCASIAFAFYVVSFVQADEPDKNLGILPKTETGALRFLDKFPEYDGRGVVVAIFDSGVDPGAPGLIETTDGKPKIIDMIDGTGSGDVDTSTVRKLEDGLLKGLSGRLLKPDPKWKHPTAEFHLGLKRAFDIYPPYLVSRLKRERRKKWNVEQRKVENDLRRQIADWNADHPNPTDEDRRIKADLPERLKQLTAAAKTYDDPGPVFDCVVFHDGEHWRAAIDTDEDGELADESLLTDFHTERQHATFDEDSLLNFAVNIYDEGNTLSIVIVSGAHGTHVAGIVAGNFPDQPELNGIAPGAQIVSVKIGDTRLGGMEVGAGLIRGIPAVLRNQCDLINMSYGEPTTTPNRGRLVELFTELVDKHGVIFCAAAGNDGPALSTLIAPGGSTSDVLGVGAYVSPAMMAAQYSLRGEQLATAYTWTSRGPTKDGAMGVDIFAPGGAIAPVPNSTLQKTMQMNGTSMATPNACGNIALLLSGLMANQIRYSPYSIKRSLQNTATFIDGIDKFAQGPGLLQVDKAYDYLQTNAEKTGELLRFSTELPGRNGARGLYLRSSNETSAVTDATVRVVPHFGDKAENHAKVDFDMRIDLQSTQPWIEVGGHLVLPHGGRSFAVRVDPTKLKAGVHFGQVLGFDAAHRERGPMFRLPVSVLRPTHVAMNDPETDAPTFNGQFKFSPGHIERRFFAVPPAATWAEITLRLTAETKRTFVLHPRQLAHGEPLRFAGRRKYVTLRPDVKIVESIPVRGGHTLEFALSQFWSSLGESQVECTVTFHGLMPSDQQPALSHDAPVKRIDVVATLGNERLAPRVTLKTHRTTISPGQATIKQLKSRRDNLSDNRQCYQLLLPYEFEQSQPGRVTPRFARIDGLLYDSDFGTQIWSLFDSNGRLVATDDTFPGPVRLKKGIHSLVLELRHTDIAKLEKMKKLPMSLDRPLKSQITLKAYSTRADAINRRNTFASRILRKGETESVFFSTVSLKTPAGAKPGDTLSGTMTLGTATSSRTGSGSRPGGFPIRYLVGGSVSKKREPSDGPPIPNEKRLAKSLADAKFELLKRIPFETNRELFDKTANELQKAEPDSLRVLVLRLERLDDAKHRKKRLSEVIAAADAIISNIDTEKLAAHYGTRINPEDKQASALRKKMDEQRQILIDTLYRKGRAVGYMELPDVIKDHPIVDRAAYDKAFEDNFAELRKWVDTTGQDYVLLHIRRNRRQQRFGSALKWLNKYLTTSPGNYWYHKKRRDVYQKLGWTHLWEYEKRWLLIRFPNWKKK